MRHIIVGAVALCALVACKKTTSPTLDSGTVDMSTDARDFRACNAALECVVLARSCCGTCGGPTPDDEICVRVDSEAAYKQTVCEPPVACPACAMQTNPNFFAECDSHECTTLDVHKKRLVIVSREYRLQTSRAQLLRLRHARNLELRRDCYRERHRLHTCRVRREHGTDLRMHFGASDNVRSVLRQHNALRCARDNALSATSLPGRALGTSV